MYVIKTTKATSTAKYILLDIEKVTVANTMGIATINIIKIVYNLGGSVFS